MKDNLLSMVQVEELLDQFKKEVELEPTTELFELTEEQELWYGLGISKGKTDSGIALIRVIYSNMVNNAE